MEKVNGRARGGIARAKHLTPAERKAIATRAAAMRWNTENLPRAVCSSENTPLRLVFDDGQIDDGKGL